MNKRKKPHKNCRRDEALLFRTRHHLGRQVIALAGTRQLRSQGLVPVHTHRTEGVTGSERQEGSNGSGAGTKTKAIGEMVMGTRIGTGTETGTRIGSGRAEERPRSARNRTRTVDAIRHFYSARVISSADRG